MSVLSNKKPIVIRGKRIELKPEEIPVCPYCNHFAELISSEEFYGKDYGTNLWVCSYCKDVYVSTAKDSIFPAGLLANQATRNYRKQLGNLKSELSQSGWMTEDTFQKKLSHIVKQKGQRSYIGYLTDTQCKTLIHKIGSFLYEKEYKPLFEKKS